MEIKGKVAVVTGGASGLGEATIRRLVELGARTAILDINLDKGESLSKEMSGKSFFKKTDVTQSGQVEASMKEIMERLGAIHFLLNAAGIGIAIRTVSKEGPHDLEIWTRIIHLNLIGTFDCIRWAAYYMQRNQPNDAGERGVIINTSSTAAFEGHIGQTTYAASKAGVVGMTLPLARDLSVIGVRAVTIAPGYFETPLTALATKHMKEAALGNVLFPKRTGRPEEFAMLVEQIILNPMLNGETIRLDAGLRMGMR